MSRIALVVLLAGVTASAAELEDVPARMAVVHERMAVRKLYDRSLDKATAARSLADQAVTAETPLRRYAILDEARRLATEAKNVELTLQIIDVTGQYFRINVIAEKLNTLGRQRVRTVDEQRRLLDRVVVLADAADRANDYGTVTDALKAARTMAYRVRDAELVKTLTTRAAGAAVLAREWSKIKGAAGTLETNPEDPDANLQLGLFHCLFRKEWARGLRLMAKGAERFPEPELVLTTDMGFTLPTGQDERILEMAKIARVDLQHPTDPTTCIRLGDSWVAVSKLYTGESRSFLLMRAGRWYAKAIAALSGTKRLALEQRVSRVGGIGWYGVPGGSLKGHHIYSRRCRSSITRLWARSPDATNSNPVPEALPLAYIFATSISRYFDGRSMTCFNPDNMWTGPHWGSGAWLFDEARQEVTLTFNNKISNAVQSAGTITKVFSVGLKGGKLFLYNCCQGGVETDETALEFGNKALVEFSRRE